MGKKSRTSKLNLSGHGYKHYAAQISRDWAETAPGILTAAKVLVEAGKELTSDELQELRDSLGLANKVYTRLLKIGNDKRLYRDDVGDHLPFSYATIEELTRLNNKQFEEALKQGLIHDGMTRNDAIAIRTGKKKEKMRDRFPKTRELLTIRIDDNVTDPAYIRSIRDAVAQTVEILKESEGKIGIHIDDKGLVDRAEAACDKDQSRELNQMRIDALELAKKIIRKMVREQKYELDKTKKWNPNRRAQCYEEEHSILPENDDPKVEELLDQYLRELGTDFSLNELMYDPTRAESFLYNGR